MCTCVLDVVCCGLCVVCVCLLDMNKRPLHTPSPRPLDTLRVCVSVCWCWRVCGVFKGIYHCLSVFKGV